MASITTNNLHNNNNNSNNNEDAAALERVRNRLASSPDAKLPQILQKLLRRLVTRFFLVPPSCSATADPFKPDDEGESAGVIILPKVDPNLVGILEHVRERILLNPKVLLLQQPEWIETLLLQAVMPPCDFMAGAQGNDATKAKYQGHCWVRQLRYTLPLLELAFAWGPNKNGGGKASLFLPQLIILVENIHALLPLLWNEKKQPLPNRVRNGRQDEENQRDNNELEEQNDGTEVTTANNRGEHIAKDQQQQQDLQDVWERSSWILVEQIAKASNIQPVLDWNLLGGDWDEYNSSASLKKIQDYQPTSEEQRVANAGTFHLLLDAITFDPTVTSATGYYSSRSRWQFRRQIESILNDFNQVERQRHAQHELARRDTNQRHQLVRREVSKRQDPAAWNQVELAYWRALKRCLVSYAIQVFANKGDESSEREEIMRILTGHIKPPSVLPLYNRIKPSDMIKVNARKRAKAAHEQQSRPTCSFSVQLALLHLINGDAQAYAIINKHKGASLSGCTHEEQPHHHDYLDLLGNPLGDDFSKYPSILKRVSLAKVMAQRVFSDLLRANLDITAIEKKAKSDSADLCLFFDFLFHLRRVPSLQANISNEIYERIGARTPPSVCWPVHFLWKLVEEFSHTTTTTTGNSKNNDPMVPPVLSEHSFKAAIELLDMLQDISMQRFEREQWLTRQHHSHDRRIHEHREKSAGRSPFVQEALQARSEAYQMVSHFVTEDKVILPEGSGNETKLSWTMAVRILNCMAFDDNNHTASALQATSTRVLAVYRDVVTRWKDPTEDGDLMSSLNIMLLPLLKACISASDWSRELVIQWAEDVIYHVDPLISHTILVCLSSDGVPCVAHKAKGALNRLSFPVPMEASFAKSEVSYWNLEQTDEKEAVVNDLESRIVALAQKHNGLSTKASRRVLQQFAYSVEAAENAILNNEDWQPVPSSSSCAPDKGSIEVDMGGCDESATCGVCWDEIRAGEGFALRCNHLFCSGCWRNGVEAAVGGSSFKELASFTCLQHNCRERLCKEDLAEFAPDLLPALENANLKSFLLSSPDYAFCPGADCTIVACCKGPQKQQQANCKLCDASFCFQCGDEAHSPVTCDVRRQYITRSEKVRNHADAVENKTIACPNCGVGITKNGGCMHMTCSQCLHEFCWICLSANWQDHVCNVFDGLNGVNDLQKIQFFRHRVDAHMLSAAATSRLLDDFDSYAHDLRLQSKFCEDSQLYILKSAWHTLVTARKFLANTYIAAYGMNDELDASVSREFQAHQSQLQVFVEQLSFLSDSVPNLYRSNREEDFHVRFRGLHFCTVAVSGYMQRVEAFVNKRCLKRDGGSER